MVISQEHCILYSVRKMKLAFMITENTDTSKYFLVKKVLTVENFCTAHTLLPNEDEVLYNLIKKYEH